jgi:hypothetical protein
VDTVQPRAEGAAEGEAGGEAEAEALRPEEAEAEGEALLGQLMRLSLWLSVSPTTTEPLGSTSRPLGLLKAATAELPSRKAAEPTVPARVVTAPEGASFLTRLLPLSAM